MYESRAFVLFPFPDATSLPAISLSGTVARTEGVLHLTYSLAGKLSDLDIPQPELRRYRRDNLWQTSCLEFFLAEANASNYWEFNLSPSGGWNVYRFTGYRAGMKTETAIASLPFHVTLTAEGLQLDIEVDINALLASKARVRLVIAAVIQTRAGELTYWALHHPRKQADFHDREGFVLEI